MSLSRCGIGAWGRRACGLRSWPQKPASLLVICSVVLLGACSKSESGASTGAQSCKLASEKIVYLSEGRKKMCTYRCEDGTIEGRTRKPEQECLNSVSSADG